MKEILLRAIKEFQELGKTIEVQGVFSGGKHVCKVVQY